MLCQFASFRPEIQMFYLQLPITHHEAQLVQILVTDKKEKCLFEQYPCVLLFS